MLNSLQNGRCSFIFTTHLVDTSNALVFTMKQFLFFSQFSLPYFTLTIHTNTLFLYNPATFHLSAFAYNHPNNLHQKYFPYLKHFSNPGYV